MVYQILSNKPWYPVFLSKSGGETGGALERSASLKSENQII